MKHLLIIAIVGGLSVLTYSFSSLFGAQIGFAALVVFCLCALVRVWSIRKSKKGVHGYLRNKVELRKRFSKDA